MVRPMTAQRLVIPLCLALLGACKKQAPNATYTVRGKVIAIVADNSEVQIHHEEIPDFLHRDGKGRGMAAMEMPFALTDGVLPEATKAGDIVEFTFETHWGENPTLRIVAIKKLPEGTDLDLGETEHHHHDS